MHGLKLYCCIEPSDITAIVVTDLCTNDFTISWIAANSEGLSYTVTFLPPSGGGTTVDSMDTFYNYTEPIPETTYNVSVTGRLKEITTCLGNSTTIMVTTLAVAEGVPPSKLFVAKL